MKAVFFFLLIVILCPSCNFGGGLSVVYKLPSFGGTPAADNQYFYIDLDTDRYRSSSNTVPYYEISTTEEYGDSAPEARDSVSNCEIFHDTFDDTFDEETEGLALNRVHSENNLICILDLLEYDLMVHDIHFVYNIPEGMCDNVEISFPWHFNHEILPGPEVKEVPCPENDEDCTPDWCDNREFTVNDITKTGVSCHYPGLIKPRSVRKEKERNTGRCCISQEAGEEDDFCPRSNRINEEETTVKCCSGGEKLDGSQWKPDIECFGGPALILETDDYDKNFYQDLIFELPEGGVKRTITMPDLVSINGGFGLAGDGNGIGKTSISTPFANYLEILDRDPDKLISRNQLPVFLHKSAYYDHSPEPFFEFSCLDSGGEILHKILLMIREWNTYEEFLDFWNSGGNDSADPDVEGEEGSACEYEDRATLAEEVEECNDLLDLDDIENCSGSGRGYQWCTVNGKYPRAPYEEETDEGIEQ